jgi:cytochrome c2
MTDEQVEEYGYQSAPSKSCFYKLMRDALRATGLKTKREAVELGLRTLLADPDAFIPGNNMEFHVAKPQERSDLIRFLKDGVSR